MCDSAGRESFHPWPRAAPGNGQSFKAAAAAEASLVREDLDCGCGWQGERGRSVRRRRKPMPLPLSGPSGGNGAFGRRNREREVARQQCLARTRKGTCLAVMPRQETRSGAGWAARLGSDPGPLRRRMPPPCGTASGTWESGGWWRHQPPLLCGLSSGSPPCPSPAPPPQKPSRRDATTAASALVPWGTSVSTYSSRSVAGPRVYSAPTRQSR